MVHLFARNLSNYAILSAFEAAMLTLVFDTEKKISKVNNSLYCPRRY
jgi:hypothetical protein